MANSGQVVGNDLGNSRYAFVDWQLAGQEIGNNRSLINWQAYAHFNNADNQLDNGGVGSAQVGMLWQNGGRVKNFTGVVSGHRNVALASGSFWVGHNADGTQSLEMSVGITYYQTGRSSASGWFSLPTIPRNAVMTSHQGSFTDEDNPYVTWNNPGGFQVNIRFEMGGTVFAARNNVGSPHNWVLTNAERDAMRAKLANTNSMSIRTVVATVRDGSEQNWDYRDNTYSIINALPTFTNFTYKDTNASTVAITGNDQYLIQGYSTLRATITSANKAVALKQATMNKYTYNINGVSVEQAYATTDIDKDIGVVTANADQVLTVTAVDSRTNTTAVTKTVTVIPYAPPTIMATAVRQNNFENTTDIAIGATTSLLAVGGVTKNGVVSASGVKYRIREAGGTWGSLTNRTSSYNSTTGAVTTTPFTLDLDNTKQYELEIQVTDKLVTTITTLIVDVGIPLFRLGTEAGLVYNREQPLMVSHVGMVIMSTTQDTVAKIAALYGGTWVAWGVGRVPVGVDTTQTEFNTVEKNGGHKLLQSHNHNHRQWLFNGAGSSGNHYGFGYQGNTGGAYDTLGAASSGEVWFGNFATGGGDSQNLQPYSTVYMYKRTV